MSENSIIKHWREILGLNVEQARKLANVNRSEIYRWEKKKTFNELLKTTRVFKSKYKKYMDGSYEDFYTRLKLERVSVNVSREQFAEAKKYYQKQIEKEAGKERLDGFLHCSYYNKHYKILKWRNKSKRAKPFEREKRISMFGRDYKFDVYDESLRTIRIKIDRPVDMEAALRWASIGFQTVDYTMPDGIIIDESHYKDRVGQEIIATIPLNEKTDEIEFQRTVYDGYQPSQDEGKDLNAILNVPNYMLTKQINIVLDLKSVLDSDLSTVKLSEQPWAEYTAPEQSDVEKVIPVKSEYALVWTASYDNPEPGAKFVMYWSFE